MNGRIMCSWSQPSAFSPGKTSSFGRHNIMALACTKRISRVLPLGASSRELPDDVRFSSDSLMAVFSFTILLSWVDLAALSWFLRCGECTAHVAQIAELTFFFSLYPGSGILNFKHSHSNSSIAEMPLLPNASTWLSSALGCCSWNMKRNYRLFAMQFL